MATVHYQIELIIDFFYIKVELLKISALCIFSYFICFVI